MNFLKSTWRYLWGKKWLLVVIVVLVIGIIWYIGAKSQKTTYQLVTVKQGTITETVSVTGNTTSTHNVSLAFESGGTIANVYAQIGDHVSAGQTLATLNAADLRAQVEQAQASVSAEQAQLDTLLAGPRDQNVAVSETALRAAQQSLTNAYASVPNTFTDSYAKANDATRNQLASFFTNAESNNPKLTISVTDSQIENNAETERLQATALLNAWQLELPNITAASSPATLEQALANAGTRLVSLKQLFGTITDALTKLSSQSNATTVAFQTTATTGLNEINTAATNVSTLLQNIAAQKASIAQAEAQLNLTLATSTSEDIEVQQAKVAQAQANVASVQAKLQKSSLVAPIEGIVTMQSAKPGEIASPGETMVTILAANGLEVDAYIPEIDIGKVNATDPVSMTFDAFPGETFTGSIFYVNPSETLLQGVVDYLVKISFVKPDSRMKGGLTANATITTRTKENALILPQYAVIQNDQGAFVKTVDDKDNTNQVPVTLGIQDQTGNVEILSGVTNGEQVVNIGLK
jgi:RND family efflux transporter MFP subunit